MLHEDFITFRNGYCLCVQINSENGKSGYTILNLERKIILSFAFLALLLIGIGFLWEFYYTGINNEQFQESKNATLIVDHTNQMEVGLYQTLIYLNLIHETRTSRENIKDIRDTPLPSRSKMGFNKGLEIFHSSSKELEEMQNLK